MTVFALDEEFERAKAERRKNLDRRLEREVRLETARRQRLTDRLARIPLPPHLTLSLTCAGCGWTGGLEGHNRQCATTGERSYARAVSVGGSGMFAAYERTPWRPSRFMGFGR